MCGIAGLVSLADEMVDGRLLGKMSEVMSHRGPDASGVWINRAGNVGLAHRRLSIIDLDPRSNQPMADAEGKVWLVFNGEIYNYRELKEELKEYPFRTRSDTEVIIYAYKKWGIDCIRKFRGMFAFALWDEEERTLYLVRDRMGIKPLYWTMTSRYLLFASEIKALLQCDEVKRTLNVKGLYDYLTFLITLPPDTLFEGIHKLPAGSFMVFENGVLKGPFVYWDPLENAKSMKGKGEEEIKEELLGILTESVAYRAISDVPVGVFLSGGIDSSLNATLFSRASKEPVKAFCVGYDRDYGSYKNEFPYARRMADFLGCDYYEKVIKEEELEEFLGSLVYFQDEPIADPVCVPVYFVSKLAKEHGVTVVQVGEGSDELFCGYTTWLKALKVQRLNDLPCSFPIKWLLFKAMQCWSRERSYYFELLRRGIQGERIFWGGAEAFTEAEKRFLLNPDVLGVLGDYHSWEGIRVYWDRFKQYCSEPSDLNWMTYIDLKVRLPELLLMRVDKMSMAVSVEARVPFLDHNLVEYALSIPTSIKIKGGVPKYILKKAAHGLLPSDILNRKKQGFGVPIYEWFLGNLGQVAFERLRSFTQKIPLFKWEEIERLVRERQGPKLWYLLNFQAWWDRWKITDWL